MSIPLVVAAALTVGIGIAHSVLGERYILTRLFRRDDLPHLFGSDWFTRRTLRFAWHLTTVAWFGLAVVMVLLADHFGDVAPSTAPLTSDDGSLPSRVGQVISITFALHAVITAATSRLKHFAWPVFSAIAVLVWIGV